MSFYEFKCQGCGKKFDIEDVDICDYCKNTADGNYCFRCVENKVCCGEDNE